MKYTTLHILFLMVLLLCACEDVRTEQYESGQLRTECPYVDGQKHGLEKRYYENGTLEAETHYVNGSVAGTEKAWHPNGSIRWERTYVAGQLEGPSIAYHDNGAMAEKMLYKAGRPAAFPQKFDAQGKPAVQGEFQDARDGHAYEWVRIGNQVWTKQNMAFATEEGSLCLQCDNWGRLYDFAAAQKACPEFFHLPTATDWNTLLSTVGTGPAPRLKAGWGWDPLGNGQYGNGKDEFGFGALAGGGHFAASTVPMDKRIFKDAGQRAYFWSADGERVALDFRKPAVLKELVNPAFAFSVRCILDSAQTAR